MVLVRGRDDIVNYKLYWCQGPREGIVDYTVCLLVPGRKRYSFEM